MTCPVFLADFFRAATLTILLSGTLTGAFSLGAAAQTPSTNQTVPPAPFVAPVSNQLRMTVLISDLHFGLGKRPDGQWSHKEDFRWPGALKGFLDEMGRRSENQTDLVIAGDLLELWQPPVNIVCDSAGDADLGCTVSQITAIAKTVIDAHRSDIGLLRDFAERGDNRLYVIPGNHDAALLLPEVWDLLAGQLNESSGRIGRMTNGFWKSADGRVVAEHGHQIGHDVNRYDRWPSITQADKGIVYLERPWGERFVQRVFNAEEETYEVIDNISPETVGVKYRIADRGYARTVGDFARFVVFDLFETSLGQKIATFGSEAASNDPNRWNRTKARELGYKLFFEALPEDDPLRLEIDGKDASSEALRSELSAIASDKMRLSDEEVFALCDQLKMRNAEDRCAVGTAGAALEAKLIPRSYVIRSHVDKYFQEDGRLRIFVYGHTHDYEVGWPLNMSQTNAATGKAITVHNTGAFQRTIDKAGFLQRVKQSGFSPSDALRKIKLEDLPPCYSAVIVSYASSGAVQSKTWRWHQDEGGPGELVEPGDDRCN